MRTMHVDSGAPAPGDLEPAEAWNRAGRTETCRSLWASTRSAGFTSGWRCTGNPGFCTE